MRLLLVEDNHTYVTIERRALEQQGAQCGVVHSVEEAGAWLAEHEVDAIVLDLGLGESQGLATVKAIAHLSPVPIVVVTGDPDVAERRELLAAGADDVLDKRDNVHLRLLEHVGDALAREAGRVARQTDPLRS